MHTSAVDREGKFVVQGGYATTFFHFYSCSRTGGYLGCRISFFSFFARPSCVHVVASGVSQTLAATAAMLTSMGATAEKIVLRTGRSTMRPTKVELPLNSQTAAATPSAHRDISPDLDP